MILIADKNTKFFVKNIFQWARRANYASASAACLPRDLVDQNIVNLYVAVAARVLVIREKRFIIYLLEVHTVIGCILSRLLYLQLYMNPIFSIESRQRNSSGVLVSLTAELMAWFFIFIIILQVQQELIHSDESRNKIGLYHTIVATINRSFSPSKPFLVIDRALVLARNF